MSMGESCIIADENGRIVDMNPRAKKILPILNAAVIEDLPVMFFPCSLRLRGRLSAGRKSG